MTLKCGAIVTINGYSIEIWRRWGTREAEYKRNASYASLERLNRVLSQHPFEVNIDHYTVAFAYYGGSRSPIHEKQIRMDECTGPDIDTFFQDIKHE